MAEFTHLHLHTDYSLLDGVCLMAHVKALGQRSAAMTDHGNIFGAVHFFEAGGQTGPFWIGLRRCSARAWLI
jgi:DNA polymerase III subunit alpha